jgi:hypothetical protein
VNKVKDGAHMLKYVAQRRSVENIPYHHFDRAGPRVRCKSLLVTDETSDAISLRKEPRYQLRANVTARTNNQNASTGIV